MRKILILLIMLIPAISSADDQILIISGGDNPGLNNYSQYLQTKTLFDYLLPKYRNHISIYFGAGNNESTKNPMLDVHRIDIVNQKTIHTMLTGTMTQNITANKENVSSYFLGKQAQRLTPNDNLFIFVSDHGLPNEFMENKTKPYSNNCINLWHYNGEFINNFLDKENFYRICLSKNELTTLVTDTIHPKHIIFEMSQCFSGGFHQMSVSTKDNYPTANGKICGFTSAPPDHYASGCTANANGPTYQGYERYFTEWYTGMSIPSGQPIRPAAKSMYEAHQQALLEDMTVDIPLTTSDYYLWQWANAFENPVFKSRVANFSAEKIHEIYDHYAKYIPKMQNSDFVNFNNVVSDNTDQIIKKYPNNQAFFFLSQAEKKKYLDHQEKIIGEHDQIVMAKMEGMMNIYQNIILPVWKKAIENKQVHLTEKQLKIEKEFYLQISAKHLFNYPYQFEPLYAQYLSMTHNDPDVPTYFQQRDNIIKNWASSHQLTTIKNSMDLFSSYFQGFEQDMEKIREEEKEKQLLKRIYIYNQILAAWITLQTINDTPALNELSALLECEHAV